MIVANNIMPRAFAVYWKNFDYWQVHSLLLALTNKCYWPTVRLGDVATIRNEIIPNDEFNDGKVSMLDRISFEEGKVFFGKRTTTRMVQFRAKPGDIVVSKINARKRAIGIVQYGTDVGVTIHFRALIPKTEIINTEFLWAALRSQYCTQQFEVETGGIGKGEISEERLLAINVPLPPLADQVTIVACWRKAQDNIVAATLRVEELVNEIQRRFLKYLGLKLPKLQENMKAFSLFWKDFERWGVQYNQQTFAGLNPAKGKYPTVYLRDTIADLENGWSPQCLNRPAEDEEWGVLKLGSVSFGIFNDKENKALPKNLKPLPILEVKNGEVLISRANIPRLVGACAIVNEVRPRLMLCDKIFRVVFRADSVIEPAYLAEVMKIPHVRHQIEAAATGTSPTMQNITKPALLALSLPLPPLLVQRQIIREIVKSREEIAHEREAADRLTREINAKIEALILGTKKLNDIQS